MTTLIVDFRNFANAHENDRRVTLKQMCLTLLAKGHSRYCGMVGTPHV